MSFSQVIQRKKRSQNAIHFSSHRKLDLKLILSFVKTNRNIILVFFSFVSFQCDASRRKCQCGKKNSCWIRFDLFRRSGSIFSTTRMFNQRHAAEIQQSCCTTLSRKTSSISDKSVETTRNKSLLKILERNSKEKFVVSFLLLLKIVVSRRRSQTRTQFDEQWEKRRGFLSWTFANDDAIDSRRIWNEFDEIDRT